MTVDQTSPAEESASRHGYVRCPNVRQRWYLPCPGRACLAFPMELHIDPDHAEPFAACAYEFATLRVVVLLRWPTMEDVVDFCQRHGAKAQPGLPAFANGRD